jgi:hypothetical protein
MAGSAVTAQSLSDRMGAISNNIDRTYDAAMNVKPWLDARTNAQIATELNITQGEADIYKGAMAELTTQKANWDALAWVHKLTGIGAQTIVPL